MAAVELCGAFKDEFVTSLACLALYDGDSEITSESINALLKASNNTGVKPYWPVLMAGMLKNGRIEGIIFSGGVAAAAPAAAGAAAPVAGAPAAAAKEEKAAKPKEEEVDALDGGMDMFGGGGAKTGDY